MSGFIDAYPPDKVKTFGFTATPRFNSNITVASSGAERRSANWQVPLHRFVAPGAVDCNTAMNAVKDMFMAMMGPLYSFPIRDPNDFASRPITVTNRAPVVTAGDQFIGTGDGVNLTFQLRKAYTFGTRTLYRPLYKPVVDSVLVALNGFAPDVAPGGPYAVAVDRLTGLVEITPPVPDGVVLTAGFLFDCEVRFEADDSYDQISRAFGVMGQADLVLIEIPPC